MIFTTLTESGVIIFNESTDPFKRFGCSDKNYELICKKILSRLKDICKKYSNKNIKYNPRIFEISEGEYYVSYDLTNLASEEEISEKYTHINDIINELKRDKSISKYFDRVYHDKYDGCIYIYIKRDISSDKEGGK